MFDFKGYQEYLERRDRVAIIIVPIMVIIFIIAYKCESDKCDPIVSRVSENLMKLCENNSIVKATIKNGDKEPVDPSLNSLVITDQQTLEQIRLLILDRKFIRVNRCISEWTAEVILTLNSGSILRIEIQKAESKSEDDEDYRLSFYEDCGERFNYGGRSLALKIKELIENRTR